MEADAAETLRRLATDGSTFESAYQGLGCSKCGGTGVAGRIGIYELYVPNEQSLQAISGGASRQDLQALAADGDQYTALLQDWFEKIKVGVEPLLTAAGLTKE